MTIKRTLGAVLATVAIGLAGCQSTEVKQKPVELPERMVDVDKDGKIERVFVTKVNNPKTNKPEYELRIEKTDEEGRLKNLEVVRNYGIMNPTTRNYLVFFYSGNPEHLQLVIDGKVH